MGSGSRIRIFLLFWSRTQGQKSTGSWILYPGSGSATLAAVLTSIDTFLFAVTTEVISLRKQLSQQQLSQQQLAQQQLAQQQQNGVHGIEDSKLLERANSLATRNVSLQVKREVRETDFNIWFNRTGLKKVGVITATGILVRLELEWYVCSVVSVFFGPKFNWFVLLLIK